MRSMMRDRAHWVCDPSSKPKSYNILMRFSRQMVFLPTLWRRRHWPPPQNSHALKIWSSSNHEGRCTPLASMDSVRDWKGYVNICNVFTPANTLKQVLMRVKSRVPEEKKKGIVYQVPCKDCNGVYTGESKGTLKVRLRTQMCNGEKWRQQRYCSTCDQEWTQYWLEKHESGEVSEGILGKESHWSPQNQMLKNSMNLDNGLQLPGTPS